MASEIGQRKGDAVGVPGDVGGMGGVPWRGAGEAR